MRVLHVFGRMDRGGAEMRTLELFTQLAPAGIRFDFATMSEEEGDLDPEIRKLGGDIYPFALTAGFWVHFWQLLRREQFSTVHSHLHLFSGLILFIARLAGIPQRIAHFRSTGDGKRLTPARRIRNWILRQLILRTATHGVGVSIASLDSAVGATWKSDPRFQVIYSGVDVGGFGEKADREEVFRELSIEANSRLVIHVGRMAPEKNHLQLIEIFAELERLDPTVRLLLVGRPEMAIQSMILKRSTELTLSHKVRIAGMRKDIPRLMASSDLMIFPSVREGLPGAVLEAIAAGIPVLASKIPGTEELEGQLPNLHFESPQTDACGWASRAHALLETQNSSSKSDIQFPVWLNATNCAKNFENLYKQSGDPLSSKSELKRPAHV